MPGSAVPVQHDGAQRRVASRIANDVHTEPHVVATKRGDAAEEQLDVARCLGKQPAEFGVAPPRPPVPASDDRVKKRVVAFGPDVTGAHGAGLIERETGGSDAPPDPPVQVPGADARRHVTVTENPGLRGRLDAAAGDEAGRELPD